MREVHVEKIINRAREKLFGFGWEVLILGCLRPDMLYRETFGHNADAQRPRKRESGVQRSPQPRLKLK